VGLKVSQAGGEVLGGLASLLSQILKRPGWGRDQDPTVRHYRPTGRRQTSTQGQREPLSMPSQSLGQKEKN
jgi:hypothetical protein